jgi:hypothetical protein
VVVLIEADDVQAAMETLASPQEPFDVWLRDHVRDAHGMDMADGLPPPEQLLDSRG